MKIRSSLTAPLVLSLALVVAACSSAPSIVIPSFGIPGGGGGATLAPGQTAVAGTACAAYPTFDLTASPQPSFPVDQTLLSKYPATIAGQPISDAQAIPFLAYLCEFLGETFVDQFGQSAAILGVDFTTASYGSFTATVGENSVDVNAIRFPGQDASAFLGKLGALGSLAGLNIPSTGLSGANVGGKNVQVTAADTDGTRDYYYPSGDTLFSMTGETDATAGPVLQALP